MSNTESQENYDYINKQASRELALQYIQFLEKEGLYTNIHNKKALVISNCTDDDETSGLDLQHILYPSGFKRENITVIERDKDVFEKMKRSKVFEGVKLINLDLEDYRSDVRFDILYLDVKCQINLPFLDTIQRLLLANVHNGTIFYLNLLAKREFGKIKTLYNILEEHIIEKLDNESDTVIGNDLNNDPLKELKQCFLGEKEYYTELKNEFLGRKNDHLIRKENIQLYLKAILDVVIHNFSKFDEIDRFISKLSNRKNIQLPFPLKIPIFEYHHKHDTTDKRKEENKDIKSLIRFLSKSLTIQYLYQFIYYNEKRSPFINTLCYLQSTNDILERNELYGFYEVVFHAFVTYYLHFSKRAIKKDNMDGGLWAWVLLNAIKNKKDISPKGESKKKREKELRKISIGLSRIYTNFKSHKLLMLEGEDRMIIKLQDWRGHSLKFIHKIDPVIYHIDKNADASAIIFRFFLIMQFIRFVEKTMDRNLSIGEINILDFKDNEFTKRRLKNHIRKISDFSKGHIIEFKTQINNIIDIVNGHMMKDANTIDDPYWRKRVTDLQQSLMDHIIKPIELLRKRDSTALPIPIKDQPKPKNKKNKKRKSKSSKSKRSDNILRIRNLNDIDNEKKRNLSKKEKEERKQIVNKYLLEFHKDLSSNNLNSSDIALQINKDIYESDGKYPDPLYKEYSIRATLAWIKMRRNKEKDSDKETLGWTDERWEEEKKKYNHKEKDKKAVMDFLESREKLKKIINY